MNVNKIIVSIIALLFIVIVGEVGYFYFFINKNTPRESANTSNTQRQPKTQNIQTYVTPTPIDYRRYMVEENVLKSSVLIDTYEAKLADIETNGEVKEVNFQFRVRFDFQVGGRVIPLYVNQSSAERITVKNSNGVIISLEDLKPGDTVRVIRDLDGLNDNSHTNVLKVEVTKLNE